MVAVADFRGDRCLWPGGKCQIGTESRQLGGQSWIAIGGLGVTVFDEQVLALDPAPFAQTAAPRVEKNWRIFQNAKASNSARRALGTQSRWRNEQRRSSRYELPPLHSILLAA
jgi:hypothetical protein